VLISAVGSPAVASLYHSGIILCLMFTYCFIRIKLFYSSLIGIIITVSYFAAHYILKDISPHELSHNSFNILGTVIMGMFIAYLTEIHMRSSFLQEQEIKENSEILENRNMVIERDLEKAREIQLGQISVKSPVSYVYSFYKPMDKIGGDFFEFIEFKESGELGVFISDVSGHGIPAALITSMLKISMSQAGERLKKPDELMAYLNGCLINHTGGSFITCFYAIIDPLKRTMRYSNAGHYPPVIIGDGRVSNLHSPRSVPLAVFNEGRLARAGREYRVSRFELRKHDRLLFYTDGLLESRNQESNTAFEYAGFRPLLESIGAGNIKGREVIPAIYKSLVEFNLGENFEDDICMIFIDLDETAR